MIGSARGNRRDGDAIHGCPAVSPGPGQHGEGKWLEQGRVTPCQDRERLGESG